MNNNWIGSVNGFGSLNSIYHKIVIPSDTWKLSHNIMVKLPPLVSPAFTRIKGIVNSFYCSFASVWNYWNSFISDKPEDVFLSRSLTQSYKGKFVEPCCSMTTIAMICKIAKGFFPVVDNFEIHYSQTDAGVTLEFYTVYENSEGSAQSPTNIVWSLTESTRRVNLTSNVSNVGETLSQYNFDRRNPDLTPIKVTLLFPDPGSSRSNDTPNKLGFFDWISYFIFQCQEVERNLSNHGVPTDLIAKTQLGYFQNDFFNLLPFMCESSIWHNFYRDEQNQSPELDYREVNGCVSNPTHFGGAYNGSMPYGWNVRLLGIPPNVSTGSDYWWKISSQEEMFSLLTGFNLEQMLRSVITSRSSATDVIVLPKFYNGLLVLKYRNFEKDYFTSACVDPNYGGVSVQVPNTIDALRTASKLEEFLEVSASARDFYNFMKHLFGTNPESTRYQKPLLLGTQVIPIQIGEQLQTSQTTTGDNGSPLGERAGVADGYGNSGTVNHYFNEHGIVVSFLSFVLDSQYMQGMPFEFWHHLQLDYPFPQFANLGAESIPLKEIYYSNITPNVAVSYVEGDNNAVENNQYFTKNLVDSPNYLTTAQGVGIGLDVSVDTFNSDSSAAYVRTSAPDSSVDPPTVFGYTPRYSRWKFAQDVVAGQMRKEFEFWHTFRHFNSVPYISNNFVSYMNAGFLSDLNRIFAVVNDNSDKFIVDCFNNGSVRRCLPLVPSTTMD
jgi:hypothetical protein